MNSKVKDNNAVELELLIEKALKKIAARNEYALCKYVPGPSQGGTHGHMHHFTWRKWKTKNPAQLFALIEEYIIKQECPTPLAPKQRASRGSRKSQDKLFLTSKDIEKILELASEVEDRQLAQDLLLRFGAKRSLTILKRDLIRSIRQNQIKQDLWDIYTLSIARNISEKEDDIFSHPIERQEEAWSE